jgi:D-arabinose 1-dehydrogenase-like Zn-dependent alcohol dehydrogenase
MQGVGGLGHLGIQFAKKFGYRVAAVSRGTGNAAIAKRLGADVYIDSAATDAATELQKLGGAHVVLTTAPSGKAVSSLVGGLGANGTFVVVGASPDPIEMSPTLLILGKPTIKVWSTGTPTDSEDTLRFAEAVGICPMIEKYPLEEAAEGYARMISGDAQYRVVLTMG